MRLWFVSIFLGTSLLGCGGDSELGDNGTQKRVHSDPGTVTQLNEAEMQVLMSKAEGSFKDLLLKLGQVHNSSRRHETHLQFGQALDAEFTLELQNLNGSLSTVIRKK